jgi:hypothetical protein
MSARELLQRLTRDIAIDSDPLWARRSGSFSTGDPARHQGQESSQTDQIKLAPVRRLRLKRP